MSNTSVTVTIPQDLATQIAELSEASGISFNETLWRAVSAREAYVCSTDEWAHTQLNQLRARVSA